MAQPCYQASAAGSLILMGEYAVLKGYPCLVCAIDRTLTLKLTPLTNKNILIKSSLGEYQTTLDKLDIVSPFEYVLAGLKAQPLPSGVVVDIRSNLSPKMGLGSSAAVTVALTCALNQWLGKNPSLPELFNQALAIIHAVQGRGSGADIAASLIGGCISFKTKPFSFIPLQNRPELTVVYSGEKTTTTQALTHFSARQAHDTHFIDTTLQKLGNLSEQAIDAFKQADWSALGKLMTQAQHTLTTFGVSTSRIDEIVTELQKSTHIQGAKLSGSGLGDCVIGLGTLEKNCFGHHLLDLNIHDQGVRAC